MPPTVSVAAFVFGMVLILAAIVGKEMKIAAIELPAMSGSTRFVAGIAGVALLYIGLFDPFNRVDSSTTPPVTPTSVTPTIALATPEPTLTTLPTEAAPTPDAFASISNVRVQYDVTDPNTSLYGMNVFVSFSVSGLKGKPCRAIAYFLDSQRLALKDLNGQYNTRDGEVAAPADFTPGFDVAEYSGAAELRIFIPYDELHLLAAGTYEMYVMVRLYTLPDYRQLAQSLPVPFRVTRN